MNSLFEFTEEIQGNGSFIKKDNNTILNVKLEFNSNHKDYNKFIIKLQKLLDEARKETNLLLYSSGV